MSVTATGPVEAESGLIVNRQELDALVEERVLPVFRHKYLNVDVPQFAELVPTTENVAAVIASFDRENWAAYIKGSGRLARVHVQETDRNGFEILLPVRPRKIWKRYTGKHHRPCLRQRDRPKRPLQRKSPVLQFPPPAPGESIAAHMREVLRQLGEDPEREGLLRTPDRSEKALRFLTSGYSADLEQIVNGALFDVEYDEIVMVRDIEFFSMCEHHLLPFFGKAHVAYLPDKKVIGLSKIPAHCGCICPPLPDSGTNDAPDRRNDPGDG